MSSSTTTMGSFTISLQIYNYFRYLLVEHHCKLLVSNAGFGGAGVSRCVRNYVQMNSLQDVLLACGKKNKNGINTWTNMSICLELSIKC